MTIRLAHDFACPWCWIGLHQTKLLRAEFGVEFEWLSYELYPDGPPGPPLPRIVGPADRPRTLSRLELAYEAAEMPVPPFNMDSAFLSHPALEAVEFAKELNLHEPLIEAIYHAVWNEGRQVGDLDVLVEVAAPVIPDVKAMAVALLERRFADRIIPFDADSYATGVYNVPTFWIGDKRFAEQPIRVLRKAIMEAR